MEEKINKIIEKISWELEEAERLFIGQWNKSHELCMARIYGLIDALEIVSGNSYYIDGTALKERV